MGTGSSRAGKAHSPAGCWRRPGQGGGGGGGNSGAPAGQGRAGEAEAAAAGAEGRRFPRHTGLPPAPGDPDSDLELLDQVLEECGGGAGAGDDQRLSQAPRPGSSPLPPPPPSLRLGAGDSWRLRPAGGASGGADGSGQEQKVFSATSTQESSNFANQVPLKNPDRQAKIAYDYSEEELMATIEQEYCR